jgi:hypothetical protein
VSGVEACRAVLTRRPNHQLSSRAGPASSRRPRYNCNIRYETFIRPEKPEKRRCSVSKLGRHQRVCPNPNTQRNGVCAPCQEWIGTNLFFSSWKWNHCLLIASSASLLVVLSRPQCRCSRLSSMMMMGGCRSDNTRPTPRARR